MTRGPILIDLEDDAQAPTPDTAPPVPDPDTPPRPEGRAMQTVATLAARKPSRLARLFWGLLVAILGAVVSVAAWDFVNGLIARAPLLGYGVTGLIAAFVLVLLVIALREPGGVFPAGTHRPPAIAGRGRAVRRQPGRSPRRRG